MQPRNGHQMAGAGSPQDLPLAAGHGPTIPNYQSLDDRGHGLALQMLADGAGKPVTKPVQSGGTMGAGAPVAGRGPHIAGGRKSTLEQPALVVPGAGIDEPPGPLEAHRQLPVLAGQQRRRTLVPAEAHPSPEAQRPPLVARSRNPEIESQPARVSAGQADNRPVHHQRPAFQGLGQDAAQQILGPQQSPQETTNEQGEGPGWQRRARPTPCKRATGTPGPHRALAAAARETPHPAPSARYPCACPHPFPGGKIGDRSIYPPPVELSEHHSTGHGW